MSDTDRPKMHPGRLANLERILDDAERGNDSELADAFPYWDFMIAPYAPPDVVERIEARLRALVDATLPRWS